MDIKRLLMEFSQLDGVAGNEGQAAQFSQQLLAPYGAVRCTPLGSVLCMVRPARDGEDHILLDAHMDEIGMVVTYIEEGGFLRAAACGGIDRRLLAAAPVTIYTKTKPINGVVCSIPPHLSGDGEKKNPKVEDLYIDTGFDGDEARKIISPGDTVVLQSDSRALLSGLVSGKALDDRAGCVALLKAVDILAAEEYHCGLTVLFSSMEEVGGQGAKTAAYAVQPTHAIAVDVSYAYTPDARKEKCGLLKKGPMIAFAPILNGPMSRMLVEVAQKEGIPFQHEVMGGTTGTNADKIALSRGGVVTGLLSIPQKYMHTPIETVAVEDVENTGRLIAAYIKSIWGDCADANH